MKVISCLIILSTVAIAGKTKLEKMNGNHDDNDGGNIKKKTPILPVTEVLKVDDEAGWTKFTFGEEGTLAQTKYLIEKPTVPDGFEDDYMVQIDITDSFCPGDSFSLFVEPGKNNYKYDPMIVGHQNHSSDSIGHYLLTTPRIDLGTQVLNCSGRNPDPNETFLNGTNWSSTKFMLPAPFTIAIMADKSPYKSGVGFIRAKTSTTGCPKKEFNSIESPDGSLVLVTAPLSTQEEAITACAQLSMEPAFITPVNSEIAANLMKLKSCHSPKGYDNAWFGNLRLNTNVNLDSSPPDLGCRAFGSIGEPTDPEGPTIHIHSCKDKLPVLCAPLYPSITTTITPTTTVAVADPDVEL